MSSSQSAARIDHLLAYCRINRTEADALPSIPAVPIGYDDARAILEKLGGDPGPDGWKGAIQGVPYNMGGTPDSGANYEGWKVIR